MALWCSKHQRSTGNLCQQPQKVQHYTYVLTYVISNSVCFCPLELLLRVKGQSYWLKTVEAVKSHLSMQLIMLIIEQHNDLCKFDASLETFVLLLKSLWSY